jgi:hypothetical protein
MDRNDIIAALKESRHIMMEYQKRHKELRANHLEELAEAIVLHQSPNLIHDSVSHIKEERISQQKQQKVQREKKCHTHRKIGATLSPNLMLGLSRVDVPDVSAKGPVLGDPNDPKTWKGPWATLTNPSDIAKVIKKMNT